MKIRRFLIAASLLLSARAGFAEFQGFRYDRTSGHCFNYQGKQGRNSDFLGECGDFRGQDMHHYDLSRFDLRGADLRGTDLSTSELSGLDLSGADLRGAKLPSIVSPGIVLEHAQLGNANLQGANLVRARLAGADLTGADLSSAKLDGADLSSAVLTSSILNGCQGERVNLNGAKLAGAKLYESQLLFSDFSGADLTSANLQRANLANGNLHGVRLTGASLIGANVEHSLVDAQTFTGAIFDEETRPLGTALLIRDAERMGAVFRSSSPHFQDYRFASDAGICTNPNGNTGHNQSYFGECGDLTQGSLTDQTITDRNFAGVLLDRQKIKNLHLRRIRLQGASFRQTEISGSSIIASDLTGAVLDGARWSDVILTQAPGNENGSAPLAPCLIASEPTWAGFLAIEREVSSLANVKGEYLWFTRTQAAGADFSHSQIRGDFEDSDLARANFSFSKLSHTDFGNVTLQAANFDESDLTFASFIAADITGAFFQKAILEGASLRYAKNLESAKFVGADVSDQTELPQNVAWSTAFSLGMRVRECGSVGAAADRVADCSNIFGERARECTTIASDADEASRISCPDAAKMSDKQKLMKRTWSLVAQVQDRQSGAASQIWRDDRTGLVWSGRSLKPAFWASAQTYCSEPHQEKSTLNLKRLPSGADWEIAREHGVGAVFIGRGFNDQPDQWNEYLGWSTTPSPSAPADGARRLLFDERGYYVTFPDNFAWIRCVGAD